MFSIVSAWRKPNGMECAKQELANTSPRPCYWELSHFPIAMAIKLTSPRPCYWEVTRFPIAVAIKALPLALAIGK